MKINCKLCKRKVSDNAGAKWRHILKYHPGDTLRHLLPLLKNPESAKEIGSYLGQRVKKEFLQ